MCKVAENYNTQGKYLKMVLKYLSKFYLVKFHNWLFQIVTVRFSFLLQMFICCLIIPLYGCYVTYSSISGSIGGNCNTDIVIRTIQSVIIYF